MLIEVLFLSLGLGELAYGNKIIKSCSWTKTFNMKEQCSYVKEDKIEDSEAPNKRTFSPEMDPNLVGSALLSGS